MATYLVTGTSSGIGRATALALAEKGHSVLAGVRHAEDAPQAAGVEAVVLDVTDEAHVAALGQRLAGTHLDGLVNNAGIAVSGPLEGLDADAWRHQFEVNVISLVSVTRAALPALRAARGRIVNVGSIGAVVSPPFVGPYAASKGAVRALSASLRRELLPLGIHVTLVEPGAIDTPIWQKGLDESEGQLAGMSAEVRAVYGTRLLGMKATTEETARGAVSPEEAARVIVGALLASRPPAQAFVGRRAKVMALTQRMLPTGVFDRLVVRATGGS
jgi:NAD(P)-dependent dehydrogenase (short-subunit alcohol dehydrogenase family)